MRYLKHYKRCVSETLDALPWDSIGHVLGRLHDARLRRASIFICGNGGSAATASHFVSDLNKGANAKGMPRFRAMALVDNIPLLTAWSNDASYGDAFAEQLRNLARPGDLVIGISGSGNSPNVLNAVRYAHQIGATTIGLTGGQGGKLAGLVDLAVIVPNACMEQIEDAHMFLEHALVSALRDRAQRERVPSLLLPEVWPTYGASGGLRPMGHGRGAVFVSRDGILVDPACGWDSPPGHLKLTSGAVSDGPGLCRGRAHRRRGLVPPQRERRLRMLWAAGEAAATHGWCAQPGYGQFVPAGGFGASRRAGDGCRLQDGPSPDRAWPRGALAGGGALGPALRGAPRC